MSTMRKALALVGIAVALQFCTSRPVAAVGLVTQSGPRLSTTAGGGGGSDPLVHWIDPLSYSKPVGVSISEPATGGNEYWVDLTSGAGSTCSMASPCDDMDDVIGKTGINGGPAVIHVKGTGGMSWFNDTVQGTGDNDCRTASCTNWILVTTWPAGSTGCSSECTGTFTGNSNMNSSTVNHVIFDGGPDLKIRLNSTGSTGQYVHNINSNWFVIYRTQMFCTGANNQLGWQIGSTTVAQHVKFINNEFYGCDATGDQISSVYLGPGTGGGYSDFVFQNNIVRDMFGDGIEVNPRASSTGITITGNLFHHDGIGTCTTYIPAPPSGWNCRPAITMANQGPGNGNTDTVITNNVMFHTGSGCIWDRGAGTNAAIIEGNTCYDYAVGDGRALDPNPEGITDISGGGTSAAVRNNIIYTANQTSISNPLGASYPNANHNACASGKTCGSSSQVWTTGNWLSISSASSDFLKIGSGSIARDAGATGIPLTFDYMLNPRPQNTLYDIGAFEYTP